MDWKDGFGLHTSARLPAGDGHLYEGRLWNRGYAGGVREVYLDPDDGLSINWGAKGSDVYAPILGSTGSMLTMKVTDELEDLIGARSGEWRLEITRGGSTFWIGDVETGNYEDDLMGEAAPMRIEANDGFGALKQLIFFQWVGKLRWPYIGQRSRIEILRIALGKLGYDLPIRSAIAWRPSSVGASQDPLAALTVESLAYYTNGGHAWSCYQVVEETARRFGARLCLWAAPGDELAWWIVSREYLDGTPFTAHRYTATGAADGTMTAGAGTEVVYRESHKRGFRPSFGAVAVVQEHGDIPPLIEEGRFGHLRDRIKIKNKVWPFRQTTTFPPPIVSGTWTYTGAAKAREAKPLKKRRKGANVHWYSADAGAHVSMRNYVHSVPSGIHGQGVDDPAEVKRRVVEGQLSGASYGTTVYDGGVAHAECVGDPVGVGEVITFSGEVTIEFNEGNGLGLFNTYWALAIEGTDYYLNWDGTWAQGTGDNVQAQYLVPPALNDPDWNSSGVNLDKPIPFKFTAAPAPAAGPVRLRLYGTSDDGGANHDPGDVLWDEVFVLVTDTEGEARSAQRTEAFMATADEAREDIVVLTGEGPSMRLSTTMLAGGQKATGWSSALLGGGHTLDSLHAETVLRFTTRHLAFHHTTFQGAPVSPIAPAMIFGDPFVAQQLTLDLCHFQAPGEFVAYLFDAPAQLPLLDSLPGFQARAIQIEMGAVDPVGTVYTEAPPAEGPVGTQEIPEPLPGGGGGGTTKESFLAGDCYETALARGLLKPGETRVQMTPVPALTKPLSTPDYDFLVSVRAAAQDSPVLKVGYRTDYSFEVEAAAAPVDSVGISALITRLKSEDPNCAPCWRRNTWHDVSSLCAPFPVFPVARQESAAAAIGRKLYVFGGDNAGLWDGYMRWFDLDTQAWGVSSTTFPTGGSRSGHGIFVYGTDLLVFAGQQTGGFEADYPVGTYWYHTTTDTWSAGPNMPDSTALGVKDGVIFESYDHERGRVQIASAQIGGAGTTGYVYGGANEDGELDEIAVFNGSSWSLSATLLPNAIAGAAAVYAPPVGGIVFLGGHRHYDSGGGIYVNEMVLPVRQTTSGTGFSSYTNLSEGRWKPSLGATAENVYIVGGAAGYQSGETNRGTNWRYRSGEIIKDGLDIPGAANDAAFATIEGMICVVGGNRSTNNGHAGGSERFDVYVPFEGAINPFTGEAAV